MDCGTVRTVVLQVAVLALLCTRCAGVCPYAHGRHSPSDMHVHAGGDASESEGVVLPPGHENLIQLHSQVIGDDDEKTIGVVSGGGGSAPTDELPSHTAASLTNHARPRRSPLPPRPKAIPRSLTSPATTRQPASMVPAPSEINTISDDSDDSLSGTQLASIPGKEVAQPYPTSRAVSNDFRNHNGDLQQVQSWWKDTHQPTTEQRNRFNLWGFESMLEDPRLHAVLGAWGINSPRAVFHAVQRQAMPELLGDLSFERGFVPRAQTPVQFPAGSRQHEVWDAMIARLPTLIEETTLESGSNELFRALDSMPVLSGEACKVPSASDKGLDDRPDDAAPADCVPDRHLNRAFILLTYMTQAYVYQTTTAYWSGNRKLERVAPSDETPRPDSLTGPLKQVARRLHRYNAVVTDPGLSWTEMFTNNFSYKDERAAKCEARDPDEDCEAPSLENAVNIASWTKVECEAVFTLVPVEMTALTGPIIENILKIITVIEDSQLTPSLLPRTQLERSRWRLLRTRKYQLRYRPAMVTVTQVLLSIREHIDAYTAVFKKMNGSSCPPIDWWDKVSVWAQPIGESRGANGAQFLPVILMDFFLGRPVWNSGLGQLMAENLYFLPPNHRAFVMAVLESPFNLRTFVSNSVSIENKYFRQLAFSQQTSPSEDLRRVFNECVDAHSEWLSVHANKAAGYIDAGTRNGIPRGFSGKSTEMKKKKVGVEEDTPTPRFGLAPGRSRSTVDIKSLPSDPVTRSPSLEMFVSSDANGVDAAQEAVDQDVDIVGLRQCYGKKILDQFTKAMDLIHNSRGERPLAKIRQTLKIPFKVTSTNPTCSRHDRVTGECERPIVLSSERIMKVTLDAKGAPFQMNFMPGDHVHILPRNNEHLSAGVLDVLAHIQRTSSLSSKHVFTDETVTPIMDVREMNVREMNVFLKSPEWKNAVFERENAFKDTRWTFLTPLHLFDRQAKVYVSKSREDWESVYQFASMRLEDFVKYAALRPVSAVMVQKMAMIVDGKSIGYSSTSIDFSQNVDKLMWNQKKKKYFSNLVENFVSEGIEVPDLLTTFHTLFPGRFSHPDFFNHLVENLSDLLPPTVPRTYSISNAPSETQEDTVVQLTVKKEIYKCNGGEERQKWRICMGDMSNNFFGKRQNLAYKYVYLDSDTWRTPAQAKFVLPEGRYIVPDSRGTVEPMKRLVMFAAGSGMAPFLGMIASRRANVIRSKSFYTSKARSLESVWLLVLGQTWEGIPYREQLVDFCLKHGMRLTVVLTRTDMRQLSVAESYSRVSTSKELADGRMEVLLITSEKFASLKRKRGFPVMRRVIIQRRKEMYRWLNGDVMPVNFTPRNEFLMEVKMKDNFKHQGIAYLCGHPEFSVAVREALTIVSLENGSLRMNRHVGKDFVAKYWDIREESYSSGKRENTAAVSSSALNGPSTNSMRREYTCEQVQGHAASSSIMAIPSREGVPSKGHRRPSPSMEYVAASIFDDRDSGRTEAKYDTSDVSESGSATPLVGEGAPARTNFDCWIVVNGRVYDVSKYLANKDHPGGNDLITPYCGTDVTSIFSQVGHSISAYHLLGDSFFIGSVGEDQSYLDVEGVCSDIRGVALVRFPKDDQLGALEKRLLGEAEPTSKLLNGEYLIEGSLWFRTMVWISGGRSVNFEKPNPRVFESSYREQHLKELADGGKQSSESESSPPMEISLRILDLVSMRLVTKKRTVGKAAGKAADKAPKEEADVPAPISSLAGLQAAGPFKVRQNVGQLEEAMVAMTQLEKFTKGRGRRHNPDIEAQLLQEAKSALSPEAGAGEREPWRVLVLHSITGQFEFIAYDQVMQSNRGVSEKHSDDIELLDLAGSGLADPKKDRQRRKEEQKLVGALFSTMSEVYSAVRGCRNMNYRQPDGYSKAEIRNGFYPLDDIDVLPNRRHERVVKLTSTSQTLLPRVERTNSDLSGYRSGVPLKKSGVRVGPEYKDLMESTNAGMEVSSDGI